MKEETTTIPKKLLSHKGAIDCTEQLVSASFTSDKILARETRR